MTSEYKPEIKELLSSGECSLKSGVFLVEGFSKSALYDINSGNVYSLDKNAQACYPTGKGSTPPRPFPRPSCYPG